MNKKKCPKCGVEREQSAIECEKCGIVFSKFKESEYQKELNKNRESKKLQTDENQRQYTEGYEFKGKDPQAVRELFLGGFMFFGMGGLLSIFGILAIIGIPMIIISLLVLIFSICFKLVNPDIRLLKGSCPYCGEGISAKPKQKKIKCLACKNNSIIRNNRFYLVAS